MSRRPRSPKASAAAQQQDQQQQTPQALIFCDPTSKKQLAPPLFVDDHFPTLAYQSRKDVPKSATHWGQLKLFLSELQLLTLILPDPLEPHWIIYVGSAPGQHLLYLDRLFGHRHEWELVDPGKFDSSLHNAVAAAATGEDGGNNNNHGPKFRLRSEFFDNNAAYELMSRRLRRARTPALAAVYDEIIDAFPRTTQQQQQQQHKSATTGDNNNNQTAGDDVNAARTEEIPIRNEPSAPLPGGLGLLLRASASRVKTLFVSDVRSGDEKNATFEQHVFENTLAQETWTDILQPSFAMLKYRLPYTSIRREDPSRPGRFVQVPGELGAESLHLNGRVLLPVFARLTSTEARLIVAEGALRSMRNHAKYENQMFFFNSVLRETVHFAAATENVAASSSRGGNEDDGNDDDQTQQHIPFELDHRYDGAATYFVLQQYLEKVASRLDTAVSGSNSSRNKKKSTSSFSYPKTVPELSAAISRQLHGTIAGAAKRCDDKLIELSSKLPAVAQEKVRGVVARADAFRSLERWRTVVTEEEVAEALKTSSSSSGSPLWPGRLFRL